MDKLTVLIMSTVLMVFGNQANAGLSGSLSPDKITERLKPFAKVIIGGEVKKAVPKVLSIAEKAEELYHSVCYVCHDSGASGAPKMGDVSAWGKRLNKGLEVLYFNAVHGIRAMPAKGGCSSCSEEDIHHAIDFIVSKSK